MKKYSLLHMPTGLICRQFFTEREVLDAITSYEKHIEEGSKLKIYKIGSTGLIWINSRQPDTADCEIKISTMREFVVIEYEN